MELKKSQSKRRALVLVNYAGLVLIVAGFYIAKTAGWSAWLNWVMAFLLAVIIVTFIVLHLRTGLWRLAHARIENLDERQVTVTHESLRHSYSIFSIVTLAVILLTALVGYGGDSMGMVVLWCLLYLAHTLPSSVIAWSEREF